MAGRKHPVRRDEVRVEWGHRRWAPWLKRQPPLTFIIRTAPLNAYHMQAVDDGVLHYAVPAPIMPLWQPLLAELQEEQARRYAGLGEPVSDDADIYPPALRDDRVHRCDVCRGSFVASDARTCYCSETCRNVAAKPSKRAQQVKYTIARGKQRLAARRNRACAHCGQPFTPKRASASKGRFCSVRCRVAAHRKHRSLSA